jgi:hypothetical protein
MQFRIMRHSGLGSPAAPADAIESLWQRLKPGVKLNDDDVSLTRVGAQIWLTWGPDVSTSPDSRERSEIGRSAVVNLVRSVCEQSPELEFGWFAVGFID